MHLYFGFNEEEEYVPPPELIEGLVSKDSLTFIYGHPGTGKSILAMGLAATLAEEEQAFFLLISSGDGGTDVTCMTPSTRNGLSQTFHSGATNPSHSLTYLYFPAQFARLGRRCDTWRYGYEEFGFDPDWQLVHPYRWGQGGARLSMAPDTWRGR